MLNSPLKSQRFLITGASSGIGAATAWGLARAGAELVLVARRSDRLELMAQELKKEIPGVKAQCLALDVTAANFIDRLKDEGALDVHGLINNAGLAIGRETVQDSRWSDWEQMLKVNVDAAFRLAHAVVPGMLARRHGDIVNLCSIAGHLTYPGGAVYCATKHALWAFTKVLREETCGQNLRVMQISPGMVETEFSLVRFHGDAQKARQVYDRMTPLSSEDIARQILFMLEQPRHVCIDEIVTMPTDQGSATTVSRRS